MKQKLLNTLQGWSLRILTAGLIIFTGYNPVMADEAVLDAADYSADYTFGSKTVSDITFTATNNGSGNGIKYFASSKSFRIYGGASLNITANSKYVITKVVIARGDNSTSNQTWVSGVSSTPVGFNTDNDTWTGSSQTVSIKNGGSSGNTRFTKVTVTYSAVDTSLGDIMYGDALANGGLTADAEHGDVFTFTAENAESMSINVGADTEAVATGTNSVSWTAPKVTSENTAYNLKITATRGTETKEASYTVYVSPAPACGAVVYDPASGEIIKGSFVNQ